jgi:membrane protease YdiL (CAAX protease family)
VAASSLLFAAAHPPEQLLPQLLLGAALGTACVSARGNLLAPLLGHAAYNAAIVAATQLAQQGTGHV